MIYLLTNQVSYTDIQGSDENPLNEKKENKTMIALAT